MNDADRDRTTSRTKHLWTLHKGGRQISCFLSDLESGGFELKLTRSDAATRSVQLYRLRDDAILEAQRQARNFVAHGWAIHGD